jgi:hypothetical protein
MRSEAGDAWTLAQGVGWQVRLDHLDLNRIISWDSIAPGPAPVMQQDDVVMGHC